MRNRIRNVWDAIADKNIRERIAKQERIRAQACMDMLEDEPLEFRVISSPHPTIPGLLLGHLVLFVGTIPAMTVASGSKQM